MNRIRPAAVAGHFYPARADVLRTMVDDLLRDADTDAPAPKAFIAPHAGYIYSGPVAASAYARLRGRSSQIRRVVLIGPAHRVGFSGVAAPQAAYFETPLGRVAIDQAWTDAVLQLPWSMRSDRPHAMEHSLEVHLPFLQATVDEFTLVPLLVGDAPAEQVAAALERLWGGPETLVVVSSDLSHYLEYEAARAIDAATSDAIASLRWEDLDYHRACGCRPIQGLLVAAGRYGLRCELIDLRNSGDTAGSRDRVVGYGAYAFA